MQPKKTLVIIANSIHESDLKCKHDCLLTIVKLLGTFMKLIKESKAIRSRFYSKRKKI
jgi:hypothetical protein